MRLTHTYVTHRESLLKMHLANQQHRQETGGKLNQQHKLVTTMIVQTADCFNESFGIAKWSSN